MGALDGKIVMTTSEGRPCWVKGRRAIFHRWTDSARPVKPVGIDQDTEERLQKWSVHGIVEYEDGTVEREWPSAIRFADSAEYFDNLAWEQMEARRDATDGQETTEQPAAMINEMCNDCAHYETPDKDMCIENGYDCINCTAGCICNTCTLGDKWEPKGGTV